MTTRSFVSASALRLAPKVGSLAPESLIDSTNKMAGALPAAAAADLALVNELRWEGLAEKKVRPLSPPRGEEHSRCVPLWTTTATWFATPPLLRAAVR